METNDGPNQPDGDENAPSFKVKPLGHALKEIRDVPGNVADRAARFFQSIGINSPWTLFAMRERGELESYAGRAEISASELRKIVDVLAESIPEDAKREIAEEARKPRATGQIDWTNPELKRFYEDRGIKEPRRITRKEFEAVRLSPRIPHLVPRGPKKAVDLRPFLGDARDQNPRGTCAVFAGTAVAEALEYFRDRRRGTVDLAEEFVWWYRGAGQRYSAGGYDCNAAVDDIRDVGACEEYLLPYRQVQINDNHTHVPISDQAMDRAQFYKGGDATGLPWGDVDAVKQVLESGRCVCYASNLDGWNTGTGEISMPPAGTALGGGHCTAIVGYIDRDDLPAELGGGYFIIRNSWGGAGSAANVLGPEYGGHLLMPYAWYQSYAGWPGTTTDKNDEGHGNRWLVEYFDNPELKGAPLETRSVEIDWLIFSTTVTVPLAEEVADVDFSWGSRSPVTIRLPPWFSETDVLPVDNFSVRFSRVMRLREGWYRFHLRGDDGVRLHVDDRLVINGWKEQPSTPYVAEHYVTGGDHVLRVEYFEAHGAADVHFTVEPINWHYELFRDPGLTGAPAATFDDTLTRLEWRHAPPVTGLSIFTHGRFGLRGTATFSFRAGNHRFHNFSTGHARVYLDGSLIADLPNSGDHQEVSVSAGAHEVRVEFAHTTNVPPTGSHTYYRALCHVTWSESFWHARFYKNARAEYYSTHMGELGPDANYVFFRTNGLAGPVVHTHDLPESTPMNNRLDFNSWDDFRSKASIPATLDLKFWGVWISRRVAIATAGDYSLTLNANEGFRLVVDGRTIIENQAFIGSSPYNVDLPLEAGVHDISIEYNPTQWGGNLNFAVNPANWHMDLFANKTLQGSPAQTIDAPIATLVDAATSNLGVTGNYSVRANRTFWLPLGKYLVRVTADDGVRVKVNQRLLIDAWYDQPPTDYSATFEHMGGYVPVVVEYYQGGGGAALQFSLYPTDFYAEYYAAKTLNAMPAGVTRPRTTPIAYRYDGDINFDWGAGSQLPRVGATQFSARWRGRVSLPVGRWRIDATADDGIRVYVDGRLLIDQWRDQSRTTHSRMIDLVGREHDVAVEYYQNTGVGACRVKYIRVI
jgi:hypothetical protein